MKQSVKWTVLVSSCLCLLGGLAVAQPVFKPTKDPLAGSRLFGSKGCVKCHAINGVGGHSGPDLARIQRPRTFYDLAATMWDHLPRMAEQMQKLGIPRPHLNPREIGDLIAFLFTLNYFGTSGDAIAGRQLFIEKKCIMCHQVGGIGGVVGPNLDFLKQYGSPIFVATAMWNHGPAMIEMMRAKGIKRPVFTESELLDLIAYLRSVSKTLAEGPVNVFPGRAYAGRQLFADKKCAECHSLREGLWPREGPNLLKLGLHKSLIRFAVAMWNKAPAMVEAMRARRFPVPKLKAQEMADLVAYLFSIEYFAKPGDPDKGRDLIAAKGCLECHALAGRGGKVARDFSELQELDTPSSVISTLWNHSFGMEHLMEQRKISWPQIRPEEMADLVAFLQSQGEMQ